MKLSLAFFCIAACSAADLTGNWASAIAATDGSGRKTYFNLKQDRARITGHIWERHIYYTIKESTGDAAGFTFTGSMMDGKNERTVRYEGA
jgi:hypothetical protein